MNNNLAHAIKRILKLLPANKRKRFWILMFLAIAVALGETVTLGVIALFATSISNPDAVMQSSLYSRCAAYYPPLAAMSTQDLLIRLSILVIILVAAKNILRGLIQFSYIRLMAFCSSYLGETMLNGLMRMPYQWLMKRNSADLISTVQWATISGNFLNSVFMIITEVALMIFMFTSLLLTNPFIVMFAIGAIAIPSFFLVRNLKHRIDAAASLGFDHRLAANKHLQTALQAIKDVKAFGKEEVFCQTYSNHARAFPIHQGNQEMLSNLPGWILETFGFLMLGMTTMTMYVFMEDTSARITGTIALLAVSAWRGLPAAIRVVTSINKLRNNLPYTTDTISNMEEIYYQTKQYAEGQHPAPPAPMSRLLEMKSIFFQYNEEEGDILKDVSFSVHKGETIGIVGESGAGKSTLMDILIGLLSPNKGTLELDGTPLGKIGAGSLASLTGYIPQSPYIIDGTLAENIAFGEPLNSISQERLVKAAKQAGVTQFLDSLDNGFQTRIGERGIRLSGGQQQRVCIARALYKQPDILVFDEATSSLDAKSERLIQETILGLKGLVTMIIVAHRLSSVEDCDRLIWIEKGTIRDMGTPAEILPEYRRMLKDTSTQVNKDEQ